MSTTVYRYTRPRLQAGRPTLPLTNVSRPCSRSVAVARRRNASTVITNFAAESTAITTLNIATRLGSAAGTATLAALLTAGPATASASYQPAFIGAAGAALIATGVSTLPPTKAG